jgi:chromosome segregation ATPase
LTNKHTKQLVLCHSFTLRHRCLHLQAGYQVFDASQEERRIAGRYRDELKAAAAAESSGEKDQKLLQALESKALEQQSALTAFETELDAARQTVATLEGQIEAALQEAADLAATQQQVKERMATLIAEAARRRENATVSWEQIMFKSCL